MGFNDLLAAFNAVLCHKFLAIWTNEFATNGRRKCESLFRTSSLRLLAGTRILVESIKEIYLRQEEILNCYVNFKSQGTRT